MHRLMYKLLENMEGRYIKMQLRNYQHECLSCIENSEDKKILVVLPTGTGKTIIFSHLPKIYPEARFLIIAHREELIFQTYAKMKQINPNKIIGIEKAELTTDENSSIVIGSIQTLQNKGRLKKLGKFDILIIDEAHHSTAKTYMSLIRSVRAKKVIGFTATPKRTDNVGLNAVYKNMVYKKNLIEMVNEKWLCQLKAMRIYVKWEKNVKERNGDFDNKDLAHEMSHEINNQQIAETIKKFAKKRKKIIVFAVNVAHAKLLSEYIRKSTGRKTEFIYGNMGKDKRREIINDFRNGKIEILVNCMILTEGFDEPGIDCVVMARPTRSEILYQQMIGRGTRLNKGKKNLLIIDVVGNTEQYPIKQITINDLFGDDPKYNDIKSSSSSTTNLEYDDILTDKKYVLLYNFINIFSAMIEEISNDFTLIVKSVFAFFMTVSGMLNFNKTES